MKLKEDFEDLRVRGTAFDEGTVKSHLSYIAG